MANTTHFPRLRSLPRALALALSIGGAMLVAPSALAGEVRFGAEPLETDDAGKLTEAGKSAAVKELPSLPGEEVWNLHLWAKIDKGAPGPLYVEFYDKLPGSGKRYKAWAYEHAGYEGGEYVSLDLELEGDVGFNRGHTYTVELAQVDNKGKNLKLATGQLTLVYTEGKPEDEEDEEGEGEDEGEEESAQDERDSLAGDGGEGGDGEAPPAVPPPSTKKGCRVDPGMGAAPGVLVLMVLGAGVARRRRR